MYGLSKFNYGLGSIWDELRDLGQRGLEAAAQTIDLEIRRKIAEWGVATYEQLPPEVRSDIERKVAQTKAREVAAAGWPWFLAVGILGGIVVSRVLRRRR